MADVLEAMRAAWRASARYTVYRTQIGASKVVLSSGLPYDEAKAAVAVAENAIRAEPGYRAGVMGRPMALMQLEDADAARLKFRSLLGPEVSKC